MHHVVRDGCISEEAFLGHTQYRRENHVEQQWTRAMIEIYQVYFFGYIFFFCDEITLLLNRKPSGGEK